jgi:hypothetical protein
MTTANIVPTAPTDGIVYANGTVLGATEVDLASATAVDPIPVEFNQEITASVAIAISGGPTSGDAYIVLQHDHGDGNWFDLAWQNVRGADGNQAPVYNLTSLKIGFASTNNPPPAKVRTAGTNPGTAGTTGGAINGGLLGGRLRFTGKSTLSGGTPVCSVTITYKLRAPR